MKFIILGLIFFIIHLQSVKNIFIPIFHNSFFDLSYFIPFNVFLIMIASGIVYAYVNKINLKDRFVIGKFIRYSLLAGIFFSLLLLLETFGISIIKSQLYWVALQGLSRFFLFIGLISVAFNLLEQKEIFDSTSIGIFQKSIVFVALVIIVSKFIFVENLASYLTPFIIQKMNFYNYSFTLFFMISVSLSLLIAFILVFAFSHFSTLFSKLQHHLYSYWLLLSGILIYIAWFYIKALYFNPKNGDTGIMTITDYASKYLEVTYVILFLVSFMILLTQLKNTRNFKYSV